MTATRDTDAASASLSFAPTSLLVATDGSPSAEAAATHAIELTARTDATLHVLAVVDDDRVASFTTEQMRRRARTTAAVDAETAVTSVGRRATAAGVHVRTAVEEGEPAAVVADYATDVGVDVVVVGTRGETDARRFSLGGVTETLLDRVDSAVLVVPNERAGRTAAYRRVLLGVDGDRSRARATSAALSLAAAYGADVRALSVVDDRLAGTAAARASLDAAAQTTAQAVALDGVKAGVSVAPSVETGVPAARIIDAASAGADLVVVGARSGSADAPAPLGNVARRVVRGSSVPVLVVRDGETTPGGSTATRR
ncbi:universal stress protein [Halogeometricum limi]|uniref:Nucleotide-binding universal stress protein, UspA family n=1 Tax=Halogeometricum limi TaxID=555875 RepID=A0A1I6HYP4_9EURY|nr:universal stress protein [Halogeometricum limi]SFR59524.1 Nucleotide-binding universal stress protein, UspA family [Halogeometricum limi]